MSEKKLITAEELSLIKYQDLKAKFTELGIPEVWKGGAKKEDLISKAIELLSEVNIEGPTDAEQADLEIPETEKEDLEIPETEKEDSEKEDSEKEDSEKAGEASDTSDTDKPDEEKEKIPTIEKDPEVTDKPLHKDPYNYAQYSKEVLTKALKTTKSNLLNNIPAQRELLLLKMTLIEKALEAKE